MSLKIGFDNKGITLMELVISMAIASLILTMLAFFIGGVSRSFQRSNEEVNLQMEAQVALNQISNQAMEAKDIIMPTDASDPDRRYIFQEYNNIDAYVIIYKGSEKKLYAVKTTIPNAGTVSDFTDADNLLAEYVSDIKMVKDEHDSTVTIDLKLSTGSENYTVSRQIKLRNK